MLMLGAWYVSLLAVLFCVVCLFMMLVILIQKPRGGGLSGAFGGGGGGSQAVFGSKTGDVLTWFTVGCFVGFLLLAMGLTWAIKLDHQDPQGQVQPVIIDSGLDSDLDSDSDLDVDSQSREPSPLPVDVNPGSTPTGSESSDTSITPAPESPSPASGSPAPGSPEKPGTQGDTGPMESGVQNGVVDEVLPPQPEGGQP